MLRRRSVWLILFLLVMMSVTDIRGQVFDGQLVRTNLGFVLAQDAQGRWNWRANPVKPVSLVKGDGFLFSAYQNDSLYLAGNWPGYALWEGGARNAEGEYVLVPVCQTGRFTEDEWSALSSGQQYRIAFGTESWPVEYGAPFIDRDQNGRYDHDASQLPALPLDDPVVIGHEAMWCVTNDGPVWGRFRHEMPRRGLHFRHLLWSYAGIGCPEKVVFHRLRVINTTTAPLRNAVISFVSDVSIGADPNDDLVGVDSTLKLAYFYNDADIPQPVDSLPAGGYLLLQGPAVEDPGGLGMFNLSLREGIRNLPYSSFTYLPFADSSLALLDTAAQAFPASLRNIIEGKRADGSMQWDPVATQETRFAVSGNPLQQAGWTDSQEGGGMERRLVLSMGPFHMAPGDTQEVVIGRIAEQSATQLETLLALFDHAQCVRQHYESQFATNVPVLPQPVGLRLGAVWPQPVAAGHHGMISTDLELQQSSTVTLKLADILGRTKVVEEYGRLPAGTTRLHLPVESQLRPGVYMLVAESGVRRVGTMVVVE